MYILATVQNTQPDTSAAEIDTLLHLHFILPAVISEQKKLPMCEETKTSTLLHNKTKGPVFQAKTHGHVHTQSDSHLSSPQKQTKNCFNGTEKQKTITNDTTYGNIPWGKMSLHPLIMHMES
jgi:hypothetical protein